MITKPKYIKDAIIWNRHIGQHGAWVRIRDINLIDDNRDGPHYEPAYSGIPRFIIREAYPYQDWMEKYIGTSEDLRADKQFNF